jgi:hypothetical protein
MTHLRITPLNRPVRPAYSPREQTQAEKDEEARWIAARQAQRAEFLAQWTPPFPSPDDIEDPRHFEASAIEWAAFECWQLRRNGFVAAATGPFWVDHVADFWLTSCGDDNGVLEKLETAASITLPFLMKGGEFSVTYESAKEHDHLGSGRIGTWLGWEKRLRVKSEHGIHHGWLKQDGGEMSFDLVVLPSGTPQDVADRVAAAYGKIATLDMPKDYPAVMPPQESCMVCGRPFTDQVSKTIGIGPTCAKHLRVPYSVDYANHIITRRQTLLRELGLTSTVLD